MKPGMTSNATRPAIGEEHSLTADLRRRWGRIEPGRVCLMGVGDDTLGDDGFGVRLAEAMLAVRSFRVIRAGSSPERFIGQVLELDVDHLVFLDAVECGAMPGTVVFLDAAEIESRFPQWSTHKLSLGLLAQYIEASSAIRTWLLGVQPESLQPRPGLSPAIQTALDILKGVLLEVLG